MSPLPALDLSLKNDDQELKLPASGSANSAVDMLSSSELSDQLVAPTQPTYMVSEDGCPVPDPSDTPSPQLGAEAMTSLQALAKVVTRSRS